MSDKYNGWTNRETWAAHLWLTNSEASQEYWAKQISDLKAQRLKAIEDATNLDSIFQANVSDWVTLADRLKEYFEDWSADALEGRASREAISMLQDIGSLWRVNWDEVARALSEDAP